MEILLFAAENLNEVTESQDGNSLWFALCAGILFISLWLMLRRRLVKDRYSSCRTTTLSTEKLNTAVDKHLDQALETYETVRELTGKLDTKIRILDALIRDADRAAARLEAAQRGETPPVREERPAESCVDEIHLYANYGFSASDIASRLAVPVESVERILAERS